MVFNSLEARANPKGILAFIDRTRHNKDHALLTRAGKAWVHQDGNGYNLQLTQKKTIVVRLPHFKP